MEHNNQLDFQLKIFVLELDTIPTSAKTSPTVAMTTTSSAQPVNGYVTRTIDIFDVNQRDIDYRAEGNANIVLAIPQRCQVLRLPKKSKSKQNICRSTTKECWQSERFFCLYKYIEHVSTLFGPNISSRPILMRVEFCNVDAFNTWLHNRRPRHRIQSKRDDFEFDYGLLYHDACSLNLYLESTRAFQVTTISDNMWAVEIKPKQGWNICTLPEWILDLLAISHDLRNKCRFCAMQHLKVHEQKQLHRISEYCPLDLFSGDVLRMKNSIRHLIASPQNNFRVFRNGQLVYSDDYPEQALQSILSTHFGKNSNIVNEFISLLVHILQYGFKSEIDLNFSQVDTSRIKSDSTTAKDRCLLQSSSRLPKHSILKRVLDLQLLVKETIPYVAQKYCDKTNEWESLKSCEEWQKSHVLELCQKISQSDQNIAETIDYEYLKTICKLNDEELYEIGATALDSSIMLTFQSIDQQSNHNNRYPIVQLNGQQFIVNATVFDLDPKFYPRHFSKYVQKTRDSFSAYKLFLGATSL